MIIFHTILVKCADFEFAPTMMYKKKLISIEAIYNNYCTGFNELYVKHKTIFIVISFYLL